MILNPHQYPTRQTGAVLLVSLVLLLILTVIGMSAVHITTLDTRISANTKDRSLAFDAAETALNMAGQAIAPGKPLPDSSTPGFLDAGMADNWWKSQPETWWTGKWSPVAGFTGRNAADNGIGYVIEQPIETRTSGAGQKVANLTLGEPRPVTRFYRITGRGKGPGGSTVHVQSVYARKVYLNTAN